MELSKKDMEDALKKLDFPYNIPDWYKRGRGWQWT